MRPLRYSINITLDGCCDHRAMFADEDLHRHAAENLDQADAAPPRRASSTVCSWRGNISLSALVHRALRSRSGHCGGDMAGGASRTPLHTDSSRGRSARAACTHSEYWLPTGDSENAMLAGRPLGRIEQ